MFTENGVIQYIQAFEYDNNYRLVNAEAYGKNNNYNMNYKLQMDYSPAGRILRKFMRGNKKDNNGVHPFAYENHYNYGHHSNPFAIDIVDNHLGSDEHFEWDRKGNMVYHLDKHTITERRFSWTEDNRLKAVVDNYTGSFYNYDAAGERNYKLTGSTVEVYQNGGIVYTPVFDKHTLYASPLITINEQGYTKHYFEEGSRICSSIGSGGFKEMYYPIEDLYEETPSGSNGGVVIFPNTTAGLPWNAIQKNSQYSVEYAYRRNFNVEPYINRVGDLYNVVRHYETYNGDPEPVFYYHSDHLGSASYITDDRANVIQQIAYLPYGEDWVDIRSNGFFGSAYKFNGKEKDDETGYNYYGARYYTDRLSIWLSVDPLTDKYPSISPYAYCNNNPVRYIDPDGRNPFLTSGAAGLALVEYGLIAAGIITTGRILYLCSDGTIRIKDSVKAKFGAMATIMIANLLSEAKRFANVINGEATQKPSNKDQSVSNNSSTTTASPDPDESSNKDNNKSINQLQQDVDKGKAPESIKRFDKGSIKGEQPHVHFKDGSALNKDGTWKHGEKVLTNKEKQYLQKNGWKIPE